MHQQFELSIDPPATACVVDAGFDLPTDAPAPESITVRYAIGNEEPTVVTIAAGKAH